MYVENPNMTWD